MPTKGKMSFSKICKKLSNNCRCFKSCRMFVQNQNYGQAALSLLFIPISPPYSFFNSPDPPLIKLEITPPITTNQPNHAKVIIFIKILYVCFSIRPLFQNSYCFFVYFFYVLYNRVFLIGAETSLG